MKLKQKANDRAADCKSLQIAPLIWLRCLATTDPERWTYERPAPEKNLAWDGESPTLRVGAVTDYAPLAGLAGSLADAGGARRLPG
jgi:hypothetical protein